MGSVALEGFGSGGGASLNFKVVGNPQPEVPSENTIWVNTDVPIGAWYFSATQPENLNEGDVWFPVGTASPVEFNALKKNGIQVYPISAKQHISGGWVGKAVKTYIGGSWVDLWDGYLFKNGDQYNDITGGWTSSGYTVNGNVNNGATIGTNLTCVAASESSNTNGAIGTKNKVNVTDYSTLRVKGSMSGYNSNCSFHIGLVNAIGNITSFVAKVSITANGSFNKTLSLSSVNGSYYVVVYANTPGSADTWRCTLTVSEISLE